MAGITNDRIYKLISDSSSATAKLVNDTRLELKADITDVRRQFETLEAGRLTRAEGHINDLRLDMQGMVNDLKSKNKENAVAVSNISNKFLLIGGGIVIVFTAVVDAIIREIVSKIKL